MIVTEQFDHRPPRVRIETDNTTVTRVVGDSRQPVIGSVTTEITPPFRAAPTANTVSAGSAPYEAFPVAATHPETGQMVIVWRASKVHYDDVSAVTMMSRSDDDGRSWSPPRVVAAVPGKDTGPEGLTPLPGGGWGMIVMTRKPYTNYYYRADSVADTWVLVSKLPMPNGVTWAYSSCLTRIDDGTREGALIACTYGQNGPVTIAASQVLRSNDGGETWAHIATVGQDPANTSRAYLEPQVVQSPTSRDLIMLIRYQQGTSQTYQAGYVYKILVSRSKDFGVTWSRPVVAFPGMSGLPSLTVTKAGVLMTDLRVPELANGFQTNGHHAWGYSTDDGRTWRVGEDNFETGGRMVYGQFVTTSTDELILAGGVETTPSTASFINIRRFTPTIARAKNVLYDYLIPQGVPFRYDDELSSSPLLQAPSSCLWLLPAAQPELGCRLQEHQDLIGDCTPIETRSELVIPGRAPFTVTAPNGGHRQTIGVGVTGRVEAERLQECLTTNGTFFVSVPDTMWQLRGWGWVTVSEVKWEPHHTRVTEMWEVTWTLTTAEQPTPDMTTLTGWWAMPTTWARMPSKWAEMPA